ncbi:MAG TPA: hypothetical protein VEQ63_02970 [Bryobacteraceae bacterium]|nr:hypothetical protein [Bryobacteraceae bacterium]
MDEKPDQILEHIESQRNQLGANLSELEHRVRRTTDWRTHFNNNPMLMVGAAFGGGLMLGSMVGGKSGKSRYSSKSSGYRASSSASSYQPSSLSSEQSNTATSQQRHRASETIDHIKAALIAFATAKTKEFLNDALPGFNQHLQEAQSGSQGSSSTGNYGSSSGAQTQSSTPASSFGPGQSSGSYGQPSYGAGYETGPDLGSTSDLQDTGVGSSTYNRT